MLFETSRLTVRELAEQDLPELIAMLADPAVMEYSVRGVCDEQAARRFYDWCRSSYEAQGFGPWALLEKASGRLVGFCGVSPEPVAGRQEINLGYRLARRFWRQGLATEAVQGVLDYAVPRLGLESVVVIIEPEHRASLRVAEKAGFSDYHEADFHGRPVRLYRMTFEGESAHKTRQRS